MSSLLPSLTGSRPSPSMRRPKLGCRDFRGDISDALETMVSIDRLRASSSFGFITWQDGGPQRLVHDFGRTDRGSSAPMHGTSHRCTACLRPRWIRRGLGREHGRLVRDVERETEGAPLAVPADAPPLPRMDNLPAELAHPVQRPLHVRDGEVWERHPVSRSGSPRVHPQSGNVSARLPAFPLAVDPIKEFYAQESTPEPARPGRLISWELHQSEKRRHPAMIPGGRGGLTGARPRIQGQSPWGIDPASEPALHVPGGLGAPWSISALVYNRPMIKGASSNGQEREKLPPRSSSNVYERASPWTLSETTRNRSCTCTPSSGRPGGSHVALGTSHPVLAPEWRQAS